MSELHAVVGDRYVVVPHGPGEQVREGVVVEVRGPSGGPPFLVRWLDGPLELVAVGPADLVLHYERAEDLERAGSAGVPA